METFIKFVLIIFAIDRAHSYFDNTLPVLFPGSRSQKFLNGRVSTLKKFFESQLMNRPRNFKKKTFMENDNTNQNPDIASRATQQVDPQGNKKHFVMKEMPTCAKGGVHHGVLCERDVDYDQEVQKRFDEALNKANIDEKHKEYTNLLADMMVDPEGSIVVSRFGNDILENPVCPATEKVIYPQRGMTASQEWVYLLNHGKMEQGIKVEECLDTARFSRLRHLDSLTCRIGSDDGDSVCRQKYIYRKMLAMTANGSNITTESILVPSCCVCRRRIAAARIGDKEGQSGGFSISQHIAPFPGNEIDDQSELDDLRKQLRKNERRRDRKGF